jgi:hypothetical protein
MLPRNLRQYHMGIDDSLFDSNAEKYKVLCRSLHVARATLYIGYSYVFLCFVFSLYLAYHYMTAVSGQMSTEAWVYQYTARYIGFRLESFFENTDLAQLLLAITLQIIIVIMVS